jgi:hypothetical protein
MSDCYGKETFRQNVSAPSVTRVLVCDAFIVNNGLSTVVAPLQYQEYTRVKDKLQISGMYPIKAF